MGQFAKSYAERKRDERARKKMKAAINSEFKTQDMKEQALESERVENLRKKRLSKMSSHELLIYKGKNAERKHKSRQLKKKVEDDRHADNSIECSSIAEASTPYKSRQSFGKACKKNKKSLTNSSRKRKAVVCAIAGELGLNEKKVRHQANKILNAETIAIIQQFFIQSDISYTMPGMKGVMTAWTDKEKTKMTKHYLNMFLKEAYYLYKEKHFGEMHDVHFSSFCKYRPRNVLLIGKTPKDECKCMIRENFLCQLEAMDCSCQQNFWATVLCDQSPNSNCSLSNCDSCKNGIKLILCKST